MQATAEIQVHEIIAQYLDKHEHICPGSFIGNALEYVKVNFSASTLLLAIDFIKTFKTDFMKNTNDSND